MRNSRNSTARKLANLITHILSNHPRVSGVDLSHANAYAQVESQQHNPLKRTIRWHQQTLKEMGVLARVAGERGIWALSESLLAS